MADNNGGQMINRISYAEACKWGAIAIDEDPQKFTDQSIAAAANKQSNALRALAELCERAEVWNQSGGLPSEMDEELRDIMDSLAAGYLSSPAATVSNTGAHDVGRTMSDRTVTDYTKWRLSDHPCEKCGEKSVRVSSLEDEVEVRGTYYVIHCTSCEMHYKADGPDA
jgi:uncharacterized protein with von Willebrand factor type A (vWA) domain